MFDFIISVIVTHITNFLLIIPFWDKLNLIYSAQGVDFSYQYSLLCSASYLGIGLIVYFILYIFKIIISALTD